MRPASIYSPFIDYGNNNDIYVNHNPNIYASTSSACILGHGKGAACANAQRRVALTTDGARLLLITPCRSAAVLGRRAAPPLVVRGNLPS